MCRKKTKPAKVFNPVNPRDYFSSKYYKEDSFDETDTFIGAIQQNEPDLATFRDIIVHENPLPKISPKLLPKSASPLPSSSRQIKCETPQLPKRETDQQAKSELVQNKMILQNTEKLRQSNVLPSSIREIKSETLQTEIIENLQLSKSETLQLSKSEPPTDNLLLEIQQVKLKKVRCKD